MAMKFWRLAPVLLVGCMPFFGAVAQPVETAAKQAVLIDDATGSVLFEKAAGQPMPPSSMSKLMTLYLVFERIAQGRLKLDDVMGVSERAWRTGGSKMFVAVNSRVSVEDLLRGVIVQSGNDACVVLAEGLAGSESAFATEMNRRAKEIGLKDSHFTNSSGLPDDEHVMTARDLAVLAQRLIHDFPQFYGMFAELNFTYNGIRQGNRNPLLYRDTGVDGLKTGYTEAAGYGMAASAKRGDRRLILVLNGMSSVNERSREAERLFDWGFREFKHYQMVKKGQPIETIPVWLGDRPNVSLVAADDVLLTLSRQARRELKVTVSYSEPSAAPIRKGSQLGAMLIEAPRGSAVQVPLVAAEDVERLSFVGRMGAAVNYLLWGHQAP
jgi:D-alanyl-D-alanine carboxypeptidase (penicillin-binding protein 5/6)